MAQFLRAFRWPILPINDEDSEFRGLLYSHIIDRHMYLKRCYLGFFYLLDWMDFVLINFDSFERPIAEKEGKNWQQWIIRHLKFKGGMEENHGSIKRPRSSLDPCCGEWIKWAFWDLRRIILLYCILYNLHIFYSFLGV
jgi:hypothetical protein